MNQRKNELKVLFVQDSTPCIRTIKIASALKSNGLDIHLAHQGRTPDQAYGFGSSAFTTLNKLPKYKFFESGFIKDLIIKHNIQFIHFHNEPDRLGAKLISAKLGIPVVYDQHDFMSFKHKLSRKDSKYEAICNEQADASVYITCTYKAEVAKYYNLIDNSICFANYFPIENKLEQEQFLPKLSAKDGKCHLVYIGRISEHKNDHRNIIDAMKILSDKGFVIHIYPSKNKEYNIYKSIPNLFIHSKLPYNELIKEISQYDYGLSIFSDAIAKKLPHIQYALGNKNYDYICAGIPVLVQELLVESREFIVKNDFGLILDDKSPDSLPQAEQYQNIVKNILEGRDAFSMENQISRLIDHYYNTMLNFNNQSK